MLVTHLQRLVLTICWDVKGVIHEVGEVKHIEHHSDPKASWVLHKRSVPDSLWTGLLMESVTPLQSSDEFWVLIAALQASPRLSTVLITSVFSVEWERMPLWGSICIGAHSVCSHFPPRENCRPKGSFWVLTCAKGRGMIQVEWNPYYLFSATFLRIFAPTMCYNFCAELLDPHRRNLLRDMLSKLMFYGGVTVKNSYSTILITSLKLNHLIKKINVQMHMLWM